MAIVNNAMEYVYLFELVFLVFFGYILRSGITELYGSSIFSFLRKLYTVLCNSCTNPLYYQQYANVPFLPHPYQHLLFVFFWLFWQVWGDISLWFFCFFFDCLRHMEFLGQGPGPSHNCHLHCSCGNTGSLTHWARPEIKTCVLMDSSRVHNRWAIMGSPELKLF